MEPPSDELRSHVAQTTADLGAYELQDADEERLDQLLSELQEHLNAEISNTRGQFEYEDAEDLLAAADAWAGLISSAVARVYAPASPWRGGRAGWAEKIVRKLREMAAILKELLLPVKAALGAATFSISVSFPWGIGIGLSW
jgi:hypothetical protein